MERKVMQIQNGKGHLLKSRATPMRSQSHFLLKIGMMELVNIYIWNYSQILRITKKQRGNLQKSLEKSTNSSPQDHPSQQSEIIIWPYMVEINIETSKIHQ